METSARYAIVGFFAVASLLAGFFFVFWLHNSAAPGRCSTACGSNSR